MDHDSPIQSPNLDTPPPKAETSAFGSFWTELKRRKVMRVAITYAVAAWLIIQIASVTFEGFGIPIWAFRFVMLCVILGFPLALILAWAFELTPEGIKTTKHAREERGDAHVSGNQDRKRNWTAYVVGAILPTVIFGALAVYFYATRSGSEALSEEGDKSIAVLPFANLSPDPENAFFCDGVHEDVITALAKIHDLKVISRTSVLGYRGEGLNMKEIGAELGVAHLLEGSVRRAGKQVRVTAQLIDARTDEHLWAETYTVDLTDVFSVQSELANAITTSLKATLSPQEKSLIARRPTQNQAAYDLYLKARAVEESSLQFTSAMERSAYQASLLEKAVALDPDFYIGYAQLCIAHANTYWDGDWDPLSARRARAKAALDRVLQLAPDSPESKLAHGRFLHAIENDWESGLSEYRKAEAQLPNDAQLQSLIGLAQRRLGRLIESVASMERAMELDPANYRYLRNQCHSLLGMRRFAEARDLATRGLARFSESDELLRFQSVAQLEIDHDRAAYWQRERDRPFPGYFDERDKAARVFSVAYNQGDLAAAERALEDPGLNPPFFKGRIETPVIHIRAVLAFLQGRAEEARGYAEETLPYYEAVKVSRLYEAWLMGIQAEMLALAGRADEAVRLCREAMAIQLERDLYDNGGSTRRRLAKVYLILDRRDEAFDTLREMMSSLCGDGPEEIRMDPFWARVADDPRFEEILQAAKPIR